ncbi:MAG: PQQ-binding-like beta-propeller repeat protein, partial [Myxococcota bacterium]
MPRFRLVPFLLLALSLVGCEDARTGPPNASDVVAGWGSYGGDAGGQRHSPLDQITPDNVGSLEVAWTYRHGDILAGTLGEVGAHGTPASTTFQNTPILVDDTLFVCSPFNKVIALDAETGEERWKFDPEVSLAGQYLLNCRGVSAWTDARAAAGSFCATRIFTGTIDARLIALDAATGEPCPDFGDGGTVDLTEGIGEVAPGEYGVTSPPVVLGDRIVTGSMVLDNRRVDAPSGVVRAYSARTGKRLWAWNALVPGEVTTQTGAYRRGTSNAWTALSADPDRNLVYVPTGNTSPDY